MRLASVFQGLVGALLVWILIMAGPAYAGINWRMVDKPQTGGFPGQTWARISDHGLMGWDGAKLKKARAYSRRFGSGAVMIVQDGLVVDAWGSLDANFKCHSMRKSLISALYGIYVNSGQIGLQSTLAELSIDDDAGLNPEESGATVEMLLKARSGIYIPALGEAPEMKLQRPRRGSYEPGEHWYYNNWDFNALGSIFRQETGRDIFEAFKQKIAAPLGMQDFDPAQCGYRFKEARRDGTGLRSRHPYYNFRMSARDLARFGLLYLHGGQWQDSRVIPPGWVSQSLQPYSVSRPGVGYGYMWWISLGPGFLPPARLGEKAFMAMGFRGADAFGASQAQAGDSTPGGQRRHPLCSEPRRAGPPGLDDPGCIRG